LNHFTYLISINGINVPAGYGSGLENLFVAALRISRKDENNIKNSVAFSPQANYTD
jgi:hypothetical protein